MPLSKLKYRPGIVKDTTDYANTGGWFDCNLVRFRLGRPESFGGWRKAFTPTFLGTARALLRWQTLGSKLLLGIGTTVKYYIEQGAGLNDITPLVRNVVVNAPFTATSGSTTLLVTDTGHSAAEGSYVTVSGAATLGGTVTALVLNAEHVIATRVDGDSYTIELSVAANASDTGSGGATVTLQYQVNVGLNTQVGGAGWGSSIWGAGGWGEPSDETVDVALRIWTHDTFGEDLVYGVRDGQVFYWDASTGLATRGVELRTLTADATVPTLATQVLVSEIDRHVLLFGTNWGPATPQDPLLIRFSSQEDITVWTPTATNTAGDIRLSAGSRFVRAIKNKRETLVWTDSALYSLQFTGPPFTFGVQVLNSFVTINSFNAVASVDDNAFWMGRDTFYSYTGQVQPLECPLKEYVFTNFNFSQRDKVIAGVNTQDTEVLWFYPSADSEENNLYVAYNYKDGVWYHGTLSRTAWMDSGLVSNPIAAATDGHIYLHEIDTDDESVSPPQGLNAFIESSPLELGEGQENMFISRVIPDVTFFNATNNPELTMTLIAQNYPGSARGQSSPVAVERSAVIPVERFTGKVDVRLSGRSVRLRLESSKQGTRWGLGEPRVDIQPDGSR